MSKRQNDIELTDFKSSAPAKEAKQSQEQKLTPCFNCVSIFFNRNLQRSKYPMGGSRVTEYICMENALAREAAENRNGCHKDHYLYADDGSVVGYGAG